jgi:hypothetical protein
MPKLVVSTTLTSVAWQNTYGGRGRSGGGTREDQGAAEPGSTSGSWSALVGPSGLTADPASMAMPARSATPWLTGQPARSLDDLLQEVAPDLKAGSIPVSLMIQAGSSSTAPQLLVEQAQ